MLLTGKIINLKNGDEMARLISEESNISSLSDVLTGVLKGDYDDKAIRAERSAKCESAP